MELTDDEQMVAKNATDYIQQVYKIESDLALDKFFDNHSKQVDLIGKIIACEVAMFLFRRISGDDFCVSVMDNMTTIRRSLITEYEATFEKWKYLNDECIW